MLFRRLSLGEGACAHRHASNAFRLQSVVSIALTCEIFIVLRYEQLCVLCLVCLVPTGRLCACVSPSNAADDEDRSHRGTAIYRQELQAKRQHVHTCSRSSTTGRPSDSEFILTFARARTRRENTPLSVRNANAPQPLIRIWMSSYLLLDFFSHIQFFSQSFDLLIFCAKCLFGLPVSGVWVRKGNESSSILIWLSSFWRFSLRQRYVEL